MTESAHILPVEFFIEHEEHHIGHLAVRLKNPDKVLDSHQSMGKLVAVVGASGVGKTSLVRVLSNAGHFAVAFEGHAERPFQALFAGSTPGTGKQDKRYGLANQMDYLLLRTEQEKELRAAPMIGLVDGGLDLDYHGFTRLFHVRGLLSDSEFDLCRRFYDLTRRLLPPPDLVIHLTANENVIRQRLATRQRINIVSAKDTTLFNAFLDEWLDTVSPSKILQLDVSAEAPSYEQSVHMIMERIEKSIFI